MTVQELEAKVQEACTVAGQPALKQGKLTREKYLQDLSAQAVAQRHRKWAISKEYLKCEKCGQCNVKLGDIPQQLMLQRGVWEGHKSHKLWRKGNKVQCKECGGQAGQSEL